RRSHYFSERVLAVPGAADDGTLHSPLVRRQPGRLEHVPAVFSVVPVSRIRVCALAGIAPGFADAAFRTYSVAPGLARILADRPARGNLEDGYCGTSFRKNPTAADGDCRRTVSAVVGDQPAIATMVHVDLTRQVALASVRALQSRIAAGIAQLP